MNDADVLLDRIKIKRREIAGYLTKNEPKQSRFITISIVAGALAAALTAGPGVGGSGFIETASGLVSFGIRFCACLLHFCPCQQLSLMDC